MKENKIIMIHSFDKNILINCSKPMSIKTLKKELAKQLKLDEELVVLMNEEKVLEGGDIIDIDEKIANIVMYIKNDIGERAYMYSKQNEETIASLIMKVTGAKTQMEQKSVKKVKHHPFSEANELINQIFSHSPLIIPGVSTSSVRVRQELQNFLMPFFQHQPVSSTNNNQGSQNNQTNNNESNNMNITIINLAQGNNSQNHNNNSINNNQAQQNIRFPFQLIQQGNIAADEEKVKTLMELGFSEENSRKALVYTANDLDGAAELCITGRIDEMPSNANMQTFFFPIIGNNNNNNQENNENHENNSNNNNAD